MKSPKALIRASKYTIVGISLTILNFAVYTLLARTIFGNNNDLLWLDTILSYLVATIAAYFLHSKITWRERQPGRAGIVKFFAWNLITALIISPFFTWLFKFITPVYEFAYIVSSNIHLPFDYNFVESTGVFGFTSVITMILNYLFYDKLVFGEEKMPSVPDESSADDI